MLSSMHTELPVSVLPCPTRPVVITDSSTRLQVVRPPRKPIRSPDLRRVLGASGLGRSLYAKSTPCISVFAPSVHVPLHKEPWFRLAQRVRGCANRVSSGLEATVAWRTSSKSLVCSGQWRHLRKVSKTIDLRKARLSLSWMGSTSFGTKFGNGDGEDDAAAPDRPTSGSYGIPVARSDGALGGAGAGYGCVIWLTMPFSLMNDNDRSRRLRSEAERKTRWDIKREAVVDMGSRSTYTPKLSA
jgi:hypothetical protein